MAYGLETPVKGEPRKPWPLLLLVVVAPEHPAAGLESDCERVGGLPTTDVAADETEAFLESRPDVLSELQSKNDDEPSPMLDDDGARVVRLTVVLLLEPLLLDANTDDGHEAREGRCAGSSLRWYCVGEAQIGESCSSMVVVRRAKLAAAVRGRCRSPGRYLDTIHTCAAFTRSSHVKAEPGW